MSAPPLAPTLRTVPLTRAEVAARLPELLRVDAETLGEPWTAAHWLAEAPDKWTLSRIVLEGARVVAFLVASRKGDALHVHRIAVHADARRRGIAAALLDALAESAAHMDVPALSLKVHASNAPALALYARLGFRTVGSTGDTLALRASVADVLALSSTAPRS